MILYPINYENGPLKPESVQCGNGERSLKGIVTYGTENCDHQHNVRYLNHLGKKFEKTS